MFHSIDKEYTKILGYKKFSFWYWLIAVSSLIIFHNIKSFFNFKSPWFSLLAIIPVILYSLFYITYDFLQTFKIYNLKEKYSFKNYRSFKHDQRIIKLAKFLKKQNFTSKKDYDILIRHYENQKEIKTKPNYLEWVMSIFIAIASLVSIFYNNKTHQLDYTKFWVIINPTIILTISIIAICIFIKFIFNSMIIPKKETRSQLYEDTIYLYLNFDKIKNKKDFNQH